MHDCCDERSDAEIAVLEKEIIKLLINFHTLVMKYRQEREEDESARSFVVDGTDVSHQVQKKDRKTGSFVVYGMGILHQVQFEILNKVSPETDEDARLLLRHEYCRCLFEGESISNTTGVVSIKTLSIIDIAVRRIWDLMGSKICDLPRHEGNVSLDSLRSLLSKVETVSTIGVNDSHHNTV